METKAFKALNAENELPGQSELMPGGYVVFPDEQGERGDSSGNA